MNFYLTLIYGSFGVMSMFSCVYFGVLLKQVIPFMFFAVIGFFLLIMGYKVSPYKEDNK
jgi:hypothetical protein